MGVFSVLPHITLIQKLEEVFQNVSGAVSLSCLKSFPDFLSGLLTSTPSVSCLHPGVPLVISAASLPTLRGRRCTPAAMATFQCLEDKPLHPCCPSACFRRSPRVRLLPPPSLHVSSLVRIPFIIHERGSYFQY